MGTRCVGLGRAVKGGHQRNLGGRVASYLSTPGLDLHQAPFEVVHITRDKSRCCHEYIYMIHPSVFGQKLLAALQEDILALFAPCSNPSFPHALLVKALG